MKSLLLYSLLWAAGSFAFAAAEPETIEIVNEAGEVVTTPAAKPKSEGSTSQGQRSHRRFQAGGLVGVTVPPIVSGGAWFGFLLDEDSILSLELTHGKASPKTFFNAEATTFGVHYQKFLANSFYLKAGLDDRRARIMDTKYRYASPDSRVETEKGEFLVADAHLGNQWQFRGFTFGVDWFGLTSPLVRLSSSEDLEGFSADDRSTIQQQWQGMEWATSFQYTRVFVGGSW